MHDFSKINKCTERHWRTETQRTKKPHWVFVSEDTSDLCLRRLPCLLREIIDFAGKCVSQRLGKLLKWEGMLSLLEAYVLCRPNSRYLELWHLGTQWKGPENRRHGTRTAIAGWSLTTQSLTTLLPVFWGKQPNCVSCKSPAKTLVSGLGSELDQAVLRIDKVSKLQK